MPEENNHTPIEKVSIIVSRGSLEGVYPGLIMANGARMEGIDASLFFTFFGLDAIMNKRMDRLKVATVGNPATARPRYCLWFPAGRPGPLAVSRHAQRLHSFHSDFGPG